MAPRTRTCFGSPRDIALASNLLPLFSSRIKPPIALRSRLYAKHPGDFKTASRNIFCPGAPEVEAQVKRNLIDLRVKLHASMYSFFLAQSWTASQPSVVSVVRASPRENTERPARNRVPTQLAEPRVRVYFSIENTVLGRMCE